MEEEQSITICVQDQTGERTMFRIRRSTQMGRVFSAFAARKGVAELSLRFLVDGEDIVRSDTPLSLDLEDDDQIDCILMQCGMISTFTYSNRNDDLINYLMMTDEERATSPVPLRELQLKQLRHLADPDLQFTYDGNPEILNEMQQNVLCNLLQFVWTETANTYGNDRVDMRLALTCEQIVSILVPLDDVLDDAYKSTQLDEKFNNIFAAIPNVDIQSGYKIALRMTRGPTNSCINFHCDGGYATSTSQIPLNNTLEYDGGELVYFTNDQLHHIPRPPGSLVQHPPNILHGVTSVTRGTRKSMFILDESNGLGEEGVVTLTEDDITSFSSTVAYLIVRGDPSSFLENPLRLLERYYTTSDYVERAMQL